MVSDRFLSSVEFRILFPAAAGALGRRAHSSGARIGGAAAPTGWLGMSGSAAAARREQQLQAPVLCSLLLPFAGLHLLLRAHSRPTSAGPRASGSDLPSERGQAGPSSVTLLASAHLL